MNSSLTFEKPDTGTFRNLALATDAMMRGGNVPCIVNAANEIAVAAFLLDRIGFLRHQPARSLVIGISSDDLFPVRETHEMIERMQKRVITLVKGRVADISAEPKPEVDA